MATTDRFGVEKLYPDGGRQWFSSWDDGHARTLVGGHTDPRDPEFQLRGTSAALVIDGRGVARLSGATPRMYVFADGETWRNVEITFYARRVAEYAVKSSQGFVAGARSEHQAIRDHPCNARTYYGRLLYDGRAHFIKELKHVEGEGGELVYTRANPPDGRVAWNPPDPTLPVGEWIGYKFVVFNVASDTQVRLMLFRDRSGGLGWGYWEKVAQLDDTGDWTAASDCRHPANQVFTGAATSVFVRNDYLVAAEYARFSVREIDPG